MSLNDIYFTATNSISRDLWFRDFGFSLPAGATISGITLNVSVSSTGGFSKSTGFIFNSFARLIVADTLVGDNKAINTVKNLMDDSVNTIDFSIGSKSDLWGTSGGTALTATLLNNSATFGVALAFARSGTGFINNYETQHLRIESVGMVIYYSLGGITQYVQENVLYGSKNDGKVYILSEYIFVDGKTNDVDDILAFIRRSGVITYKTLKNKRVKKLHLRILKGLTAPTSQYTGNLYLTYNDNYRSRWKVDLNQIVIPLTSTSEPDSTSIEAMIPRLGVYRTRQYQFLVKDNMPFVLVEVEEEVDLLRD